MAGAEPKSQATSNANGFIFIGSDDEAPQASPWDKVQPTALSRIKPVASSQLGSNGTTYKIKCELWLLQHGEAEQPQGRLSATVFVSLVEGTPAAAQNARKSMCKSSTCDQQKSLKLATLQAASVVPVAQIQGMEVRRQGKLVVVKLTQPGDLGRLTSGRPDRSANGTCKEFGLVVSHSIDLQTLFSWVPHVQMEKPLGRAECMVKLDGIPLTDRDVKLLDDEQCLNDSALDFFLRLVLHLTAPPELKSVLYVVSSFFYNKLTSNGVSSGDQGWENVQRWTQRLPRAATEYQYIFVPVNELNLHWWLAVICNPINAVLQQPKIETAAETPRIVVLDSAEEPLEKQLAAMFLRGYVWRETLERFKESDPARAQGVRSKDDVAKAMRTYIAEVPKQENGYDCGVFVIEFLLRLMTSPPSLKGLGLVKHGHWFNQQTASHRRKQLKQIANLLLSSCVRLGESDVQKLLLEPRLVENVRKRLTDKPSQGAESRKPQEGGGTYANGKRPPGRPPETPRAMPKRRVA